MSSYKQTIVCVQPNQTPPDAFWETILKEFPSCAGFATAVDGTIQQFAQSNPIENIGEVKELLEEYKSSVSFLVFGNYAEGFSENSVQPFVTVKDDQDDIVLVTLMDGNFDERIVEGRNESGELATHDEIIVPSFIKSWKAADKDTDAFMQDLSTDPSIPKTIDLLYKGRATVTFLGANGESLTLGTNGLRAEYAWGWCSNPGSYKEAGAEDTKPSLLDKAKTAVRSSFGNRGPAPTSPAVGTTTPAAPTGLPDKVTQTASATAAKTHTVLHKSDAAEMVGPPANLNTKREIQGWYVEHNGAVIPTNWKDRPKIVDQKPDKLKETVISAALDAAKERVDDTGKAVRMEVLPVISPQSLKYFKDDFKKGVVQKTVSEGKVTLDPKRVAEMESTYPSFIEATGIENYNMLYGLEQEDWQELIAKAPDLVRVLVTHLLLEDYKVSLALGKHTEARVAEQTEKHVEGIHTLKNDPPPSIKRASFGNRRVS